MDNIIQELEKKHKKILNKGEEIIELIKKNTINKSIININKELEEILIGVKKLKSENNNLSNNKDEIELLSEGYINLSYNIARKQDENKKLKKELHDIGIKNNEKENIISDLRNSNSDQTTRILDLQVKIVELKEQLADLSDISGNSQFDIKYGNDNNIQLKNIIEIDLDKIIEINELKDAENILSLLGDYQEEDIYFNYRLLLNYYHPDKKRNLSDKNINTRKTQLINEAYQFICKYYKIGKEGRKVS